MIATKLQGKPMRQGKALLRYYGSNHCRLKMLAMKSDYLVITFTVPWSLPSLRLGPWATETIMLAWELRGRTVLQWASCNGRPFAFHDMAS
jgi:hypothetical protein